MRKSVSILRKMVSRVIDPTREVAMGLINPTVEVTGSVCNPISSLRPNCPMAEREAKIWTDMYVS